MDLSVPARNAQAGNVELAHGSGSRYLVQRWGDGTICDKTGRSREVEVQFHCSMTMTDTILLVKETKTCSYVLVINTPRLCAEPGFLSRREKGDENHIHCREVVDTLPFTGDNADTSARIPDADYPSKLSRRKPKLLPVQIDGLNDQESAHDDLMRQALEAMTGTKDARSNKEEVSNDKDVIFEFIEEGDLGELEANAVDKLADILRAAGLNVQTERSKPRGKDTEDQRAEEQSTKRPPLKKNDGRHDEL